MSAVLSPRLRPVSCSQCGQNVGLGEFGYSHCRDHLLPATGARTCGHCYQEDCGLTLSQCRERRLPGNLRQVNAEREADEAFERDEALRLYRRLLSEADWSYQMAQDHHAWQDGVKQFERLYALQMLVDPDGAVWRAAAEKSGAWAAPKPRVVSEPIDLGYLSGSTL